LESRYDVLRNGLRIHSFVAGKKTHTPLVFLHGYPTNAYMWRQSYHRERYHHEGPGYISETDIKILHDIEFNELT
jgi:pimeloyl-ACP methyl ester carboxylesterase